MSKIVIGQCYCGCHNTEVKLEHTVPCCFPCPVCGQKIATVSYGSHVEVCKSASKFES